MTFKQKKKNRKKNDFKLNLKHKWLETCRNKEKRQNQRGNEIMNALVCVCVHVRACVISSYVPALSSALLVMNYLCSFSYITSVT